jgi:hypothetical protein
MFVSRFNDTVVYRDTKIYSVSNDSVGNHVEGERSGDPQHAGHAGVL